MKEKVNKSQSKVAVRDYAAISHQWCNDIVTGKIPACLAVKQACQRQLNDLKKQSDDSYPYYFDNEIANRRCRFSEYLPHVKGRWRGQKLVLSPHQIFFRCTVWGWQKKSNHKRRFRTATLFLPRKQGKSFDGADTGLYSLVADGEPGAEIYSGASTERQALEVFRPAWQMVEMMPKFREKFGVQLSGTPKNPTSIYKLSDMSRFELVIGKPPDGASPHVAIIDEYHQHATSEQLDAMKTGQGAREQPLILIVTTAGVDTSLPCYDEYLRAMKILEGSVEDDSYFALIYVIDKDMDTTDFESWKLVNPNYLVSIDEDFLKGAYNEAMTITSKQNINYCRHLNLWTNAGVGWVNMPKWLSCIDKSLQISQFKGQNCYAALDLASKIDICALVLLFEGEERKTIRKLPVINGDDKQEEQEVTISEFIIFPKFYLPEETMNLAGNEHYVKWAKDGYITVTPGARTDFLYIEDDLKAVHANNPIIELAFDPREATYLINNISQWLGSQWVDGKEQSRCVEINQGPALMSEPMKELEARIYDNTIKCAYNPAADWMMGNVVRKQGRATGPVKYYYPAKEREAFKIDFCVAAIMCVARAVNGTKKHGIYDNLTREQLIERMRL